MPRHHYRWGTGEPSPGQPEPALPLRPTMLCCLRRQLNGSGRKAGLSTEALGSRLTENSRKVCLIHEINVLGVPLQKRLLTTRISNFGSVVYKVAFCICPLGNREMHLKV